VNPIPTVSGTRRSLSPKAQNQCHSLSLWFSPRRVLKSPRSPGTTASGASEVGFHHRHHWVGVVSRTSSFMPILCHNFASARVRMKQQVLTFFGKRDKNTANTALWGCLFCLLSRGSWVRVPAGAPFLFGKPQCLGTWRPASLLGNHRSVPISVQDFSEDDTRPVVQPMRNIKTEENANEQETKRYVNVETGIYKFTNTPPTAHITRGHPSRTIEPGEVLG